MPCWLLANPPTLALVRIGMATPAAPTSGFIADWMIWAVTILLGIIGLALAWRGLIGDRAKGRPHCWKCRYDMSGGDNLTCSECGHVHKDRRRLFKTRRYYKRFIVGSLLLMAALYCHTAPQVQFRRATLGEDWWESVVPTWAWIVMVPELEDERMVFLDRRFYPPVVETLNGQNTIFTQFSAVDDTDQKVYPSLNINDRIGTLEAKLLVHAARRRLERLPQPAGQTNLRNSRNTVIHWIHAVRDQVDVTEELIWLLRNEDNSDERQWAAYSLGERPERATESVPALIAALDDLSPDVQVAACEAIGHLGAAGEPAMPKLLTMMKGTDTSYGRMSQYDYRVLTTAVRAIIAIGDASIPHLIRALESPSVIRTMVLGILTDMGPAAVDSWPVLAVLGADGELGAIYCLERVGVNFKNVPSHHQAARALVGALDSKKSNVRRAAANVFVEWNDRLLPLMEWVADQPDIPLDRGISEHIIAMGIGAAHLGPKLTRTMFRDPNRYRHVLTNVLTSLGPPSQETLTLLVEALNHDDPIAREMAQGTIEVIAPKPETMLPVLMERLKSKDASHRISTILQLANLGQPAKDALPRLRELMRADESNEVREAAAALVKVFEP